MFDAIDGDGTATRGHTGRQEPVGDGRGRGRKVAGRRQSTTQTRLFQQTKSDLRPSGLCATASKDAFMDKIVKQVELQGTKNMRTESDTEYGQDVPGDYFW